MVEVNQLFLRSVRGGLKIARMIVAFMAIISFATRQSHQAYLSLSIIEFLITLLFFLFYLFNLQKKCNFLFWPLVDALNSALSALFLFIAGLCATIIKTNLATLVGGVFFLLLCVLSAADAVFLLKKITFNRRASGSDPAHG
uniref:Chemokine like factor n=1 Tax=Salvator merianae TaxID=96440 RepID=A0A8D0BYG0_SALMN